MKNTIKTFVFATSLTMFAGISEASAQAAKEVAPQTKSQAEPAQVAPAPAPAKNPQARGEFKKAQTAKSAAAKEKKHVAQKEKKAHQKKEMPATPEMKKD